MLTWPYPSSSWNAHYWLWPSTASLWGLGPSIITLTGRPSLYMRGTPGVTGIAWLILAPSEGHPPAMLDLSGVPRDYCDLNVVFSKGKIQILPPLREFDCTINLLPGSTPPCSWLFVLLPPECFIVKKNVHSRLWSCFHWVGKLALFSGS
ncbi:hypothetical protein AOLI_G00300130 [Acnodon oligacanthus]